MLPERLARSLMYVGLTLSCVMLPCAAQANPLLKAIAKRSAGAIPREIRAGAVTALAEIGLSVPPQRMGVDIRTTDPKVVQRGWVRCI